MNSRPLVSAINALTAWYTQNLDIQCKKGQEFKQTTSHSQTNLHSDVLDTTMTTYRLKAILPTELPSTPKGFVKGLYKFGKSR